MIPHVDALATYPRIRFMGSKHKLAPRLAELFATLPPGPAIDAFSGSGVVAYTLKAGGREVLANDHLVFTSTRTGVRQLWVLDTESNRVRQLTKSAGSKTAAWSSRLAGQ